MVELANTRAGSGESHSLWALLSVPYLIEASTTEGPDGTWVRRAAYPELPGCVAEAPSIEEALRQLERRRMEIIIDTVRSGARPPVPRLPLAGCDPRTLAAELGLAALLDDALRAHPDTRGPHDAVAR